MESNETRDFSHFDLSPEMMSALAAAEYQAPTPVQAGLIPLALDEIDVAAQARTGTGKTAAFAIPILELLDLSDPSGKPQALILVPTRELAVQVKNEVDKLSQGLKMSCAAIYGGTPVKRQISQLRSGVEIVVGTPGRVIDHLQRKTLACDNIECVVLDEADRMLDVGFRPDIEKILRQCPRKRQTLLLSATMPPPVKRLAEKYMHEPEMLNFSESEMTVDTIEQHYFSVDQKQKFELLVRLLKREQPQQAIIFCRTKRGAQRVFDRLKKRFQNTGCMHGDMQQRDRYRVMRRFRSEEVQLMVSTDVMGRGIDISGISHIINFDIPSHSDDYVHRVGRTGRMGREGVAFSFVTPDEGIELTRIEQRIDRLLIRDDMPDMDLVGPPMEEQLASTSVKREVPDTLKRGSFRRKHNRRL